MTVSAPGDPYPVYPAQPVAWSFKNNSAAYGFNIIIEVHRISSFYIINSILPICLNVWLALLVFAIDPNDISGRLGIVVTLFLALTAIQFVVGSYIPSSSTIVPTQQLIITSYLVLGLIGLVCILVYLLVSQKERAEVKQRVSCAHQSFRQRWSVAKQSYTMHWTQAVAVNTAGAKWAGRMRQRKAVEEEKRGAEGGAVAADADTVADQATPAAPCRLASGSDNGSDPPRDEESGQSGQPSSSRCCSTSCCLPPWRRRAAAAAPAPGPPPALVPSKLRLKWAKLKEMIRETKENSDYALYMGLKVDIFAFVFVSIAYDLAAIVIFVVGSQKQPTVQT